MCQHAITIQYRPDPGDPDSFQDIETIDLGGGVRVGEETRRRADAAARRLCADYALARPDRAGALYIMRYNCNGPVGEPERTHPDGAVRHDPGGGAARRLAAENRMLRDTLARYADPGRWRTRPAPGGGLALPALADAGDDARRALRAALGEELP